MSYTFSKIRSGDVSRFFIRLSVSVGFNTGFVRDIRVFGHENVARLSSILNSTMAILKIAVLTTLLFAVLASAVLYLVV